jgi:hypothetical protein
MVAIANCGVKRLACHTAPRAVVASGSSETRSAGTCNFADNDFAQDGFRKIIFGKTIPNRDGRAKTAIFPRRTRKLHVI